MVCGSKENKLSPKRVTPMRTPSYNPNAGMYHLFV
jgi:hypothetical protein